jgi:glycosyltransferase involved in cell wall biosynthesis
MMSGPRFSLITIAFNDLPGLKRTVASIESQTLEDWEHVIVDGGSTDGTVEWLESLDPDARRRWTSGPDQGIYDAMNQGLARSGGQLVMFPNSGDCLADDRALSMISASQNENGWEWAYGAVRFTDSEGRPTGAYVFDPYNRTRFVMGINWIPHATVCVSAGLAGRLGAYRLDVGTSADQEYLMRAARLADPHVISWFIADFERGGVSQTVGPRDRELVWHRMRETSGTLWRGSKVMDRAVSEILSLRTPSRILAKRLGTGLRS